MAAQWDGSCHRTGIPIAGPVPFSDLSTPQSLNLYSYVRNNPVSLIDRDGHDCAYLNAAGDKAESIDHDSNAGECKANGGAWAEGRVEQSNVITDPNSGWSLIGSNLDPGVNGMTGNLTVGTPGQASDTSASAIKGFLSQGPDFIQLSVNVGIPYLANLAGPTGTMSVDRNANVYFGLGVNVGKAATLVWGVLLITSC